MLVLGAGPGGYSAAFRAADLGHEDRAGRALPDARRRVPERRLHPVEGAAARRGGDGRGARTSPTLGISFGEPKVDLAKLRALKNKVVGKLTGGLAAMAKMRKVTVVHGRRRRSVDPHHLEVRRKADGKTQTIRFSTAIIAAGSQAVKLPFLPEGRSAHRRLDRRARAAPAARRSMLVIGGGIIGLEMGTVYSTLGARLDVVEMMDGLMLGADRDLVEVWQKMNAPRFDNIMLKTKTVGAEATKDGIRVTFEGEGAPKEPQLYDLVLQAGRPRAERQAHRRRQGRRHRRRARLHPGRHPDAHQRAAHLRHRRHRRPADARAQGGARRPRRGRGRPAATEGARSTRA